MSTYYFFFLGAQYVFLGFLILFSEQHFFFYILILRTMSLAQCFWAFNSIDYSVFTCLLSCIVVHDTFLIICDLCLLRCLFD